MQRTLVSAFKVERTFLLPRESASLLLPNNDHGRTCVPPDSPLSNVSFVLDEYTLLGYTDGTASLWATSEGTPSFLYAHFSLPENWILYNHCLSADESILYIAVCRTSGLRFIYRVPLGVKQASSVAFPLPFERVTDTDLGTQYLLRSIDPESNLLLMYEFASSIVVLNWKTGKQGNVPIHMEDPGEAWIIALRLCGPFILSFTAHSIKAYPLPCVGRSPHHLPVLKHTSTGLVQDQMTLSDVHQTSRNSEEAYTIYVLAHDLHSGISYYKVTITLPLNDDAQPSSLSVDVMGKYKITAIDSFYRPQEDSTDPTFSSLTPAVRTGFVSQLSLGSTGMRGAWVEWERGSMSRRVVAFTLNPNRLAEESPVEESKPHRDCTGSARPSMTAPYLKGKCIWEYDTPSRDDMPLCAVSESTGRIVIGSGSGYVQLLECAA
ncbi:hypothetical protein V8B97DRAFT_1875024 [Scleroderma yunnanense]